MWYNEPIDHDGGVAERKGSLNHRWLLGLWYNNLTALAKSKISTPERTLYHKLRISKEIRPAAGASAVAQGARDYGIITSRRYVFL